MPCLDALQGELLVGSHLCPAFISADIIRLH